ncbi:outer membrane protein [Snuella lapsa]|uniref:Outer membrane protein beta-barrel domain-containing protein n=1 Tax=Snuella lapsa TaxID=870481 RepID=A0ABP6X802_9FLAO
MKQKLLLTLLLIFTIKLFSQDSKFTFEANYPTPIDNNFLGKESYGIIDVGLKYKAVDIKPVKLGISLNGGVLINNSNQNNGPLDFLVTTYTIQPKGFAELNINAIKKLKPFIGLGYTFMIFQVSGTNNGFDVSGESETQSGFGTNLGIAYDISNKLFIQVQYDFTKLNVDNVPDIKYNTNVNLLKIGLGLKI